MCDYYKEVKFDYLYRGDILESVPFISLDLGEIFVEPPADAKKARYQQSPFQPEGETRLSYPVACVASLERLPGVVLLRTCEANKRPKKLKVFGSVLVAPVRPFSAFPVDTHRGKPFHELVLEGFPPDNPDEEPGECYRFMALAPCAVHGMADGGMVCFREAQPVPIRHLLACKKIVRLSIEPVNVMDYRYSMYMQQGDVDNAMDDAVPESDSPVVAAYKKRLMKQEERQAAATAEAPVEES